MKFTASPANGPGLITFLASLLARSTPVSASPFSDSFIGHSFELLVHDGDMLIYTWVGFGRLVPSRVGP